MRTISECQKVQDSSKNAADLRTLNVVHAFNPGTWEAEAGGVSENETIIVCVQSSRQTRAETLSPSPPRKTDSTGLTVTQQRTLTPTVEQHKREREQDTWSKVYAGWK